MSSKSTIAKMYNDLVNAMDGIVERKYIFPGGRPDLKEAELESMTKFIVVELPSNITDIAIGNHKFMLSTGGLLRLFSKAKKNRTFNINALSDFTEEVIDKFPVSGEYIAATNPIVRAQGIDEYNYQMVTISFDVHTK